MKSSYYLLSCVTALLISLSLVSCGSKGDEPECDGPSFDIYCNDISLHIIPQDGAEINLNDLKIIDEEHRTRTPIDFTTEVEEGGGVKVNFMAPKVCRLRTKNSLPGVYTEYFKVRFAVNYGSSTTRLTGTYNYTYTVREEPFYGDPVIVLEGVTCGDVIYKKEKESDPKSNVVIKAKLQDNKLVFVQP